MIGGQDYIMRVLFFSIIGVITVQMLGGGCVIIADWYLLSGECMVGILSASASIKKSWSMS